MYVIGSHLFNVANLLFAQVHLADIGGDHCKSLALATLGIVKILMMFIKRTNTIKLRTHPDPNVRYMATQMLNYDDTLDLLDED